MRPIAVGRGNWIHIGSEHAEPRVAAIFSVIESCRGLKILVRDYLADILPGLADAPRHSFAEHAPAAWAAAGGIAGDLPEAHAVEDRVGFDLREG